LTESPALRGIRYGHHKRGHAKKNRAAGEAV